MDQKLKMLSAICTVLQCVGLFLIICILSFPNFPNFFLVLLGISGFASVVHFFLPYEPKGRIMRKIATFAGLGIIIVSLLSV